MGIDIYAQWRNQSEDEHQAQFTGFSTVAGGKGYLREAYHGGPYVTHYLVSEAFEHGGSKIPAKTLRERLPAAVVLAMIRHAKLYKGEKDPSIINAAEIDSLLGKVKGIMKEAEDKEHEEIVKQFTKETLKHAKDMIEGKILPDYAQSFVDFVELCERKEKETGEPVEIQANY